MHDWHAAHGARFVNAGLWKRPHSYPRPGESEFDAANREFRYQLTPVGGSASLYVAREVQGRSFHIAGGKPGLMVSWQITGIRREPEGEPAPVSAN